MLNPSKVGGLQFLIFILILAAGLPFFWLVNWKNWKLLEKPAEKPETGKAISFMTKCLDMAVSWD